MSNTTTRALAGRHEALAIRLDVLLRQVEKLAAKHPEAPVAAETRAVAEALLFEALPFGGTGSIPGRRRAFPVAPETLGPLAVALGQGRAALAAFEAAHTWWDAAAGCLCWRIERGPPLPAGGRAAGAARMPPAVSPLEQLRDTQVRDAVVRRLDTLLVEAYGKGFRDASAGRPHANDDDITLAGRQKQLDQG